MSTVGKLLGPMQMIVVPLGGFAVGALMDRFARGSRGAGQIDVAIACIAITLVAVAAQLLVADLRVAAVFYAVQIVCFACVPISATLVITQQARACKARRQALGSDRDLHDADRLRLWPDRR
ncbi:MAG: hypothetical protein WDN24_18315 [Sphingomonas sp.]